jgi:hypothetical protein
MPSDRLESINQGEEDRKSCHKKGKRGGSQHCGQNEPPDYQQRDED